jgi:uncharacterized protein YfaS (alpha-2-macroglobulin family)
MQARQLAAAGVGAAVGAGLLAVIGWVTGYWERDFSAESGEAVVEALPEEVPFVLEPADYAGLAPVMSATFVDGEAPTALSAHLVRPVWQRVRADQPADGTVLTIDPPVEGTLTWADPQQLVFTPRTTCASGGCVAETGFLPGRTYSVSLDAIQGGYGLVEPGDAPHASITFSTPAFVATRAVLSEVLPSSKKLSVDLVFSGPVDPESAAIEVSVDGASAEVEPVAFTPNRLRLTVPYDGERGTVVVSLPEGARSQLDDQAIAPPVRMEVPFDLTYPAVDVKRIRRVETGDGFLIEVLCHDPAAGEAKFWRDPMSNSYDYFYLSPRCALDPERALEWVHITPAVERLRVVEASGGFRLFGDFHRGAYTVRIDAGARTIDGGGMRTALGERIVIPARKPQVELVANQGRYIPRKAWTNLPIRHRNVDVVKLRVRHVPAQNLVFWLSGSESTDARTSDLVVDTVIPVSAEPDVTGTTWVDLSKLFPGDKRGLYEVTVVTPSAQARPASADEGEGEGEGEGEEGGDEARQDEPKPSQDVSRLVLTDINLVAKAAEIPPDRHWSPKIHVWALDMGTAAGLEGVAIEAVKPSGKAMARCTTDPEGGCVLELPDHDIDPTGPIALVATKGDDLTYLKFSDLQIGISEEAVAGLPYVSDVPYRASLWTERGVYRPSETVHLAAVLRGRNHAAPDPLPVTLKVFDARRKLTKTFAVDTNDAGMVAVDYALSAFAPTGTYTAHLEVGGKTVNTQTFQVEEFVPERMRVLASPSRGNALPGDEVRVGITARYLFGGSAEGSRVEVDCRLEPAPFIPGDRREYSWGVQPRQLRPDAEPLDGMRSLGAVNATIDSADAADVACPPIGAVPSQASRMVAAVSVFEAGSGRTTRTEASWRVHPDRAYLGLRTGTTLATLGEPVQVSGVAVDWEGRPLAVGEVAIEVYDLQEEWGWWWYWEWEAYREDWLHHLRPSLVEKRSVPVNAEGAFAFSFTPATGAAGYLVRAVSGQARSELTIDGAGARSWWVEPGADEQTPRPLAPTALAVSAPESAEVGEVVPVEVVAPWPGRLLFTVETNQVLTTKWIDVKEPGPVRWTFSSKTFVPNLYVSALLVKDPHLLSEASYVPDRAFGVASVRLQPAAYTMPLEIEVEHEVRSNSRLKVDVEVGSQRSPTYVTVAAVDEGILQLTRFQTPDPVPSLFPLRALGVDTYETIGWTLMLPAAGSSQSTGGDAEGAAGRVQPVKAVALWSGLVQADEHGVASVNLDIPQYRGELRVMAVAANRDRVGSASTSVVVQDPISLQTTLPRFLTGGDTFEIPVFITNASGKKRNITVALQAEALPLPGLQVDGAVAPIRFTSTPEATFALREGESKTVAFAAEAVARVGAAKLRVVATADGGLSATDELEVPFHPAGPRERQVQRVRLEEGTLDLAALLDGWAPTTSETTVWVTPNPYGESMSNLSYLLQYPHGCIEQTTSSARPLLFVRNLLPAVDARLADPARVDDMVTHGIERIFSMQTSSGGFGYWPGDDEPVAWGTAYAIHFLLDAKELGFEVAGSRLDEAIGWLEREADRNAGGQSYGAYHGWYESEPYVHYVLARAGKARKGRIDALLNRVNRSRAESVEDAYLLKAALYLAGDHRYEADLRDPDASPIRTERHNHWSFWSDLRARGMMLSTYHDLFGTGDPGAEALAQAVARGLAAAGGYTTQEVVWGTTALGKRVQGASARFSEPELRAGDKVLQAHKAGVDRMWTVQRASELDRFSLTVSDVGANAAWVIVSTQGVRERGVYPTGGNGLTVDRALLDADGEPLSLSDLELGDLVFVLDTVRNTSGDRLQNLALVDRLPAGFEIENPRLGRGRSVSWYDSDAQWDAEHLEVRDDRIELFGALDPGATVTVLFAVRAVTAGSFTLPPVEVEAMYDPAIWAREAGGKVTIDGPWEQYLL